MKVSVSIPDEILAKADNLAEQLKIPRSELYSRALGAFVEAPQKTVTCVVVQLDACQLKPHLDH